MLVNKSRLSQRLGQRKRLFSKENNCRIMSKKISIGPDLRAIRHRVPMRNYFLQHNQIEKVRKSQNLIPKLIHKRFGSWINYAVTPAKEGYRKLHSPNFSNTLIFSRTFFSLSLTVDVKLEELIQTCKISQWQCAVMVLQKQ